MSDVDLFLSIYKEKDSPHVIIPNFKLTQADLMELTLRGFDVKELDTGYYVQEIDGSDNSSEAENRLELLALKRYLRQYPLSSLPIWDYLSEEEQNLYLGNI